MIYLVFFLSAICVKCTDKTKANAAKPVLMMKMDEAALADAEKSVMGISNTAVSEQRIVGYHTIEKEVLYDLPEEEVDVLLRIVEAEAGCEDEDGKLLVANVVLNRVANDAFPDTITEVVFQRERGVTQFSPVSNGTIWSVQISEETLEAVQRALEGEDISQGALYFVARKYADSEHMKWFDRHLTFLFEHGGHEFFG
ncbi:MAG: cell wall hydrolase [Lachnospiraceae bacterium]|nr:cell wall hydrolase [Lachnospiraceae bacterium]